MEKARNRYARWQRSEGLSARTVHINQQRIRYFIDYVRSQGLPDTLDGLTVAAMRGWVEEQQDRNLSDWTIHTRVRSLKAFSHWLELEGWLDKDPLARMKPPKAQQRPKATLDPKDVEKLLQACTGSLALRDRAMLTLLYSTGLRVGELVQLQRDDIDYDQALVLIRRGKGGKFRVVPLGISTDKAIDKYLATRKDDSPALFVTDDGQPITHSTISMLLKRKGQKIGKHLYPHLFRHSFAVQFLRNGGKLEVLKQIMGHSSYEVTLHYARLAGVDITTGHEAADPMKKVKNG